MTHHQSEHSPSSESTSSTSSSFGSDPRLIKIHQKTSLRGIDYRAAPYAGVVASDVSNTENQDEEDDRAPPAEDKVFGLVPSSLIQMSIMDQVKRVPFFFLFVMLVHCLTLNFTTIRYPDPKTQNQLPDVMFDILPRIRSLEKVTAILLLIMNVSAGFVLIMCWRIATKKMEPYQLPSVRGLTPRRLLHKMVWLRYFGTYSIATILRCITISMTSMPSTDNQCKERPHIDNIWMNTLKLLVSMGSSSKSIHCGDLLFSGHTCAIMSSFWLSWTYGPLISPFIRPVVSLVTVSSFGTILSSRSHYSDDIIVAVIVVTCLFWLIGHNPSQGLPLWLQAMMQPFHTVKCIVTGAQSKLDEATTKTESSEAEQHENSSTSEEGDDDDSDQVGTITHENSGHVIVIDDEDDDGKSHF